MTTCPECAHENAGGQKFCGECGARLASRCPTCGTVSPLGQRFCGECGSAIAPDAAPAPAGPFAARFGSPHAYTPKHLAERILTSKTAIEGERKQVTVLFADMKGSTELLADRDPEEARKILDPVLERMMEAVHRYEGTVNQVMGDGIMALFGAPLAHEDHAVRACYAALRMHEAIRRYTEDVRRTHGAEVQIRVGINSGDVVVRSVGSDLRMDYTAVGQTTHLAARMEQLAPAGTTRLTAETLRLAEEFVQVRPLGPIPVKGLAAPVEVFELTGASAVRTRLQASRARGFSRFVGRDAEMEQIRQAAAQARQGRGQLVAVVGEAGVGKSRLFHEFTRSHHVLGTHGDGWRVLEASSVSYGKATPFLPLAELLRGYFRIDDRDDLRTVRAKVMGTLLTLDRALEDAVPAVLWILEVLEPGDAFLGLEPPQRRRRAMESVKRALLRESQVQPLLLLFEDLHWIDAETQAVLDSLAESLGSAPVLLAVNYRPEYRHGWGSKTYYRQLRIDPLPPESAAALLRALLGPDPSTVPLAPLLIARTEGNPLFLEESVRTLVETGALAGEPGAYRLDRPAATIQMPATVQAILAARIDRLRPELKRLLQAAAVVGKDVPVALLAAVGEMADDILHSALGELQTAELLYETRLFPDLEYTFKHALTHEVAYNGVLQERRRTLHATILETIERLHADRLGEHAEVLAHHAVRAAIPDKAIRYLREAGAKATARSANREAVDLLERALTLLAELPETRETLSEALDVRIALGTPLIAVHGPPSPLVEASYLAALSLVERLDDAARRFLVLWGLWYVRFTRGDYPPAVMAGERLLETARRGNDVEQLLEAHHTLWPSLVSMGEVRRALPHIERGIALYDRERHGSYASLYGGHDPGTCCRYFLALTHWGLGYPERALASAHEAARLAEALGHAMTSTLTLSFVTSILSLCGDAPATIAAGERCLAIVDAHGFSGRAIDIRVLLHAARGDRPDVATLDALQRERALEGSMRSWRYMMSGCTIARLYGEVDAPEQGLQVLATLGDVEGVGFCGSEVLRVEGELRRRIAPPAPDEAERCFQRAVDLARRRELKSFELRAATSLARLWRDQGRREDARRALADVYGWFTEGFHTQDLRAAKALLDQLASG
ncbi:MAG TPA: adenylate/guanylate cyclase domain-containing protein [Candidatus Limnocylindria bacterium]|nr:adenylate/guanylate cyclase domain-containing protein [Candidatus Limnocylindria bacterium]